MSAKKTIPNTKKIGEQLAALVKNGTPAEASRLLTRFEKDNRGKSGFKKSIKELAEGVADAAKYVILNADGDKAKQYGELLVTANRIYVQYSNDAYARAVTLQESMNYMSQYDDVRSLNFAVSAIREYSNALGSKSAAPELFDASFSNLLSLVGKILPKLENGLGRTKFTQNLATVIAGVNDEIRRIQKYNAGVISSIIESALRKKFTGF